ncbi:DUF6578 domain-containing protein [Leifsonia sp. 2MCAF36]|uniref:DUF6578 domain-containing protein n=1 Tax=Leifsonia sp. 2MCAF36 TaxID=3232988 RepID=UPI003F960F28
MLEATTTIDVLVFGGEYACCGVPFAIGDHITLALLAVASRSGGVDRTEYFDDRHPTNDLTPPLDVRGQVEGITAVHTRMVPVAGAHYLTSDPADRIERQVPAVPDLGGPAGYGGPDYRVRLRIPKATRLPAPDRRSDMAEPGRIPEEVPADAFLRQLTDVIGEVIARYGDAVGILRDHRDTAVTLSSQRSGAAELRWNAYGSVLTVEIERATWRLPAGDTGVRTLRDLIAAAADGGFSETLDHGTFVSLARLPDGHILRSTADAPHFPLDGGAMVVPSSTYRRMERARAGIPYLPWLADFDVQPDRAGPVGPR